MPGTALITLGLKRHLAVMINVPVAAKRTDASLMSFLKTLTCNRNKPEPQNAKLNAHTAYQTRSTERNQEMNKVIIASATVFALIVSAGMSSAHPLGGLNQQTVNLPGPGYQVTPELSNSDPCDSCSDAYS
ncbi:hypothetical protein [Ruegeria sp. A3M17]|uniref:hypothetical protein n=1 Tax=Ruegeria sp. A3M17 TaxID=2267229 RepID=UPI000DEA63F1|nr:hypothetical protein [Ruegeria sp. A3M17]RBW58806.1 hypothetical protein DS906_08405 [Ruegeria sp. A3M17]